MNKNNLSRTSVGSHKQINPKSAFQIIYFLVLLFYLVPLLGLAAGADTGRFSDYLYLYTTIFYTIIVLSIIIFDEKGLVVFQDYYSLWMIALGCFLAASQGGERDTLYKFFLVMLGLRLSIYIIVNKKSIRIPNLESVLIGFLWSLVTTVIIALLLFFFNSVHESLPRNLLAYIVDISLYQLSFITVLEEACFRGLVFSFLLLNGYQEDRALIIQGVLFWGVHYMKINSDPITFFVVVPVLTLSTSLITQKYKMLYLPVLVHTLANVFGPILAAIL